ncbi:hypothetical protein GF373_01335 [bacterium]|nr:hypothetical protein [bacterium]
MHKLILFICCCFIHNIGLGQDSIIFFDNAPNITEGDNTYDPETRTCGKGSYRVFTQLDTASNALDNADILYIRAGAYSRETVEGRYTTVHGSRVNYWTGALAINTHGSKENRKLVSAYQDEEVIIQAKSGVSEYNPDPMDENFKNSSHFYPHPAVSISGSFVDVIGLKTYGQVVINGHDISLQNCDLGGGGPHMNQGQVVALNSNRPKGVYNVLIKNNRIHHSCWGEGKTNGAALMCYNASFIVENCEFYNNYGPDVSTKDTGEQQGRDIIVRYNFFGPTSLHANGNTGFYGHNQDADIENIYVYQNIFLRKNKGISFRSNPRNEMIAYNNTFINCGLGGGENGDIADWQNPVIKVFNNLYYHAKPNQSFYDIQTEPWNRLHSDYNLFYSTTSDTTWRHKYRNRASSLSAWQEYSGKDQHSVWKQPEFKNPNGNRPEDFQRTGGSKQDVTGSPYSATCGAYITGDEIIGIRHDANGNASTVSDWYKN